MTGAINSSPIEEANYFPLSLLNHLSLCQGI